MMLLATGLIEKIKCHVILSKKNPQNSQFRTVLFFKEETIWQKQQQQNKNRSLPTYSKYTKY